MGSVPGAVREWGELCHTLVPPHHGLRAHKTFPLPRCSTLLRRLAVPIAFKEPLDPSPCPLAGLNVYGGMESQLYKWAIPNSKIGARQLTGCI